MAKQTINVGTTANDKTGDPLRTAFTKINDNFTELYGASPFGQQVTISGNQISANASNADLVLSGSGTGDVVAGAVRIHGTSITSDDSTQIQINENLDVGGNITASGNITATGNIFANGNINLGNAAGDQTKVVGVFEADQVQIDGTTITTNTTNGSLSLVGNGSGSVNVENLIFTDNTISSASNGDITLSPGGTGGVVASGLRVKGTTITADDSSIVNINEGVNIDGTLTVEGTTTTAAINTTGTHTVTGQLNADNLRMDGNVLSSTDADGDITLTPNGTGSVVASAIKINGTSISSDDSSIININDALNVDGTATIEGTLTTTDITTNGTQTITGTLNVDGVQIKDNKITTNSSDAILEVSANGSGVVDVQSAMTTIGQTVTGTMAITGQLDVDNISISGNGIIATNSGGGININPNATGQVTIGGSTVEVPSTLLASTVYAQTQILMGSNATISAAVTNQDLLLQGGPGTGAVVIDQVSITDNQITTHVSNADLKLNTDGTGLIDIRTPTQSTVGAVGAASKLPLDSANEVRPVGYLRIKISGTEYVIPYFNAS